MYSNDSLLKSLNIYRELLCKFNKRNKELYYKETKSMSLSLCNIKFSQEVKNNEALKKEVYF